MTQPDAAARREAQLRDLRQRQQAHRPADAHHDLSHPHGEVSLPDHVSRWADERGDQAAVVFATRVITYRELDAHVRAVTGWLESMGVAPGDRVAVHLPNCPQFVIMMLAALRAGAVHVPVNPMFTPDEIAYELRDSAPRVVLSARELWPHLAAALIENDLPVEQILLTSIPELVAGASTEALPESPVPLTPFADALAQARSQGAPVDLDALAALNYTGGTTGLPKGCEHTQRHMRYTALSTAAATGESTETPFVALCYLPIFWIAGEDLGIVLPIVLGGTSILMARWDADEALTQIETHGATHMVGTVENYLELMARDDIAHRDLGSLIRPMAVSFVRKLDPEVRAAWREVAGHRSVLREAAYGMTETHTMDTTPFGFQEGDRDLFEEPVFCGLPVPGTDVLIVDWTTGDPLPLGTAGEIIVRSPSVMSGYWGRPDETADQVREGWLHTGDHGRLDERGCLHFLGRAKEMIKVKGMSVFPAEIEMVIARHPAVGSCAVVATADEDRGQRPVAFVTAAPGAEVDAADIADHAGRSLAAYKVPTVVVIEDFPMTATGKIRKVDLEDRARAARG